MTEETSPTTPPEPPEPLSERPGLPTVAVGLVLVLIGAALFGGQMVGIGIEEIGWPIFVIGAGVAILVVGLVIAGESGLVIGGTITTTVGLVLFYQNQTGRWESWAYAWALVGPAASGLGLALWGLRSGKGSDVRTGICGCSAGWRYS
jgi:vacuolar-type H+-ATPase subunit I/STV1